MRVTESLIRQNKINNRKKNQYKEEDEPTMRYQEKRQEYRALNQNTSIFESKFQNGINTTENVFDQKAVFKLGK